MNRIDYIKTALVVVSLVLFTPIIPVIIARTVLQVGTETSAIMAILGGKLSWDLFPGFREFVFSTISNNSNLVDMSEFPDHCAPFWARYISFILLWMVTGVIVSIVLLETSDIVSYVPAFITSIIAMFGLTDYLLGFFKPISKMLYSRPYQPEERF